MKLKWLVCWLIGHDLEYLGTSQVGHPALEPRLLHHKCRRCQVWHHEFRRRGILPNSPAITSPITHDSPLSFQKECRKFEAVDEIMNRL